MRLGPLFVAGVFILACRADGTSGAASREDGRTAAAATEAAAGRLAGCYTLRTGSLAPYRLRLSPSGEASLIGPDAEANRPGDAWEWSATTDSTFVVSWSGVDSRMVVTVRRRERQWVADGAITTVNGETRLTPTVERVQCPPPGA